MRSASLKTKARPRGFAGVLAKLGIALVAGALLLAVVRSPELAALVSPARVEAWLIRAGPAAPLLLMGLMATAVVVSPIPSFPLDLAAGAFFGPVLGTLYSAAGALERRIAGEAGARSPEAASARQPSA